MTARNDTARTIKWGIPSAQKPSFLTDTELLMTRMERDLLAGPLWRRLQIFGEDHCIIPAISGKPKPHFFIITGASCRVTP